MPVLEYRVVEFDGAAILRAIGAVPSIAEALGLYRGAVERIEFVPERGVIAFTKRGHAAMAEIGAEALGALLVGYCACIKVPLPRRGQKKTEITSRSALLRIAIANYPETQDLPRIFSRAEPAH
ncbi:MAG TPA: hypothetical protein VIZ17_11190 [Acetobacteraceae bacterium]